jgi:FtsZ-binding cell division protein ZapB
VHHDVNNTTDYYDLPNFMMIDPSRRDLKENIDSIDILKVEVEDLKVLDTYIKSENETMKDMCAQLQRQVDELNVHKDKLQNLFKRKHNQIDSLAS